MRVIRFLPKESRNEYYDVWTQYAVNQFVPHGTVLYGGDVNEVLYGNISGVGATQVCSQPHDGMR